ncbi:MAG: nicotinate-nicotinamide nucleotide adenylyltransferase, partial [Armatimonadota bacterium]
LARLAIFERPGTNTGAVIARLPEEVQHSIDLIKAPLNRASSTTIRHLIREGQDAEMWVHPKVWEYIRERGLYQS